MSKVKTQEVQVYVAIYGDYCQWHEVSIRVVYDITNNIALDDEPLEFYENFNSEDSDYGDYEAKSALKIGDEYYINF